MVFGKYQPAVPVLEACLGISLSCSALSSVQSIQSGSKMIVACSRRGLFLHSLLSAVPFVFHLF